MKLLSEFFFIVLHWVGKAIAAGYYLLFGWYDRRFAKRQDASLAEDIIVFWNTLLLNRKGHIEPAESRKGSMDYSVCTVDFPGLQIRVVRGRGEYRVQMRQVCSGNIWCDIPDLYERLDLAVDPANKGVSQLASIGDFLDESWEAIEESTC